jgi:hypothetical protein
VVYQAGGGRETCKNRPLFSPAMRPPAPAGNGMVTALIALKHCPLPPEMSCKPAMKNHDKTTEVSNLV